MPVLTPNMSLIESTINVDSGLAWEQNLNSSLTTIDGHTHTPGKGIAVPSNGLNINTALTFQNNQATNLQATVFTQQSSLSTLNSLWVGTDGNLYFNDGAGDASLQITQAGALKVTSTGISNGTASASFISSVLTVVSAPTVPGNMSVRSILLGNDVANSKFLTLNPPSSMGSNYSLTLPALADIPGSGTFLMTLDSTGSMHSAALDGSTIVDSSGTIEVPAGGITTTQIASQTIAQGNLALRATGSTVAAGGVATSSSCATYTTSSSSFVNVTNLSITITTTGRPVQLMLQTDTTTGNGNGLQAQGTGQCNSDFQYSRGATALSISTLSSQQSSLAVAPAGSFSYVDFPTAGTYTYTVQARVSSGGGQTNMHNCYLVAYEL